MKITVCDVCGDSVPGVYMLDETPVRLDGDFCHRCFRAIQAIIREEEAKFKSACAARIAEAKPRLRDACRTCGGGGSVPDAFPDGEGGETPGESPCEECVGTGVRNGNREGARK